MAGYIGSKASVVSSGTEQKRVFNITTTTTSLTGLAYTPNQVNVFHNGVRLVDGTDFTATNGSTITLTTAAENGDQVVVIGSSSFQVADAVPITGGTFTGVVEFDNTSHIKIPVGTTAQRPSVPENGMIRYNTTTGEPEWYDTSAGDWSRFSGPLYTVEYLVVAGGGGGSGSGTGNTTWRGGGGGGAGGYRSSVSGESSGGGANAEPGLTVTSGQSYTIVIGAGGAGGAKGDSNNGENGNNSSFGSITTVGGGGGGKSLASPQQAPSGGSGGGAGSANGNNTLVGAGTTNQGFSGGQALNGSTPGPGGGGGGAGAAGTNANSSGPVLGTGGIGIQSSINGTASYRAGGGGGGQDSNGSSAAAGGNGGGGAGSFSTTSPTSATTNTGGGGGGAGASDATNGHAGGNGGSGIVIIRYAGTQRGTGGVVTSSGGYTIHTFTSSGTFTA